MVTMLSVITDILLNVVLNINKTGQSGSAGTSARGPENQEGACESLKDPIALAIDVLFLIFFHLVGRGVYFQLFLVYLKKIIM